MLSAQRTSGLRRGRGLTVQGDCGVPVGAGLGSHDAGTVHHTGDAKIRDFHDTRLIHQQVGCFEVSMGNVALVKVVHTAADVHRNPQQGGQFEGARLRTPSPTKLHRAHPSKNNTARTVRTCEDVLFGFPSKVAYRRTDPTTATACNSTKLASATNGQLKKASYVHLV